MNFRLIYKGQLRGNKSKAAQKQSIRLQLHPQIETVWAHAPFKGLFEDVTNSKGWKKDQKHRLPITRFGVDFFPLASRYIKLQADLDILLLEPLASFPVGHSRSDIDNQIKSLVDGLRMPRYAQEIPEDPKLQCFSPFYCLMEDDSLIGDFSVRTDRLLGQHDDGVGMAIIEVTLRSVGGTWFGMTLPGHKLP